MGTLLVVEALWVLLYCLFLASAPAAHEIAFFFAAVTVLILSAVELVLGLLCFIVFYHTTGAPVLRGVHARAAAPYSKRRSAARVPARLFF